MGTLANSEDPDEMPQNVAFHLGLQSVCNDKTIFRDTPENYILTCGSLI